MKLRNRNTADPPATSRKFTEEQKEFIRNNYNNPYDCTMFNDLFCRKFCKNDEDDNETEDNKDAKSEEYFQENLRLFGKPQAIVDTLCVKSDNLPHIQICQLYILDPFVLKDGSMSRPQTVYLRDPALNNMKSFYPIQESAFSDRNIDKFFDTVAE